MFQWLRKLFWFGGTSVPSSPATPAASREEHQSRRRRIIRSLLGGELPGAWASDHLEEASRCNGWTYCAVRAVALQAAQARTSCKDKATRRLLRRPNPGQSGAQLRYQMAQQACLTGDTLLWTIRNGMGVPVQMYCLPTGLTRPKGPSAEFPKGSYEVQPLNSLGLTAPDGWTTGNAWQALYLQGAEIDASQVQAIHWPHPLYLGEGLSPQAAGALALDVAQEVERARYYTLRNRSLPGLILKLNGGDITDDELETLEDEINARNAGVHNARKNLLLPPGADKVNGESAAVELDFVGSYPQVRDAVLANHGTPAVALGITDAGSYAAFYASLRQFTELTIAPLLTLLAGGLSVVLGVRVRLKPRHFDDPTIAEQRWKDAASRGSVFVDEDRKRLGLPSVNEWRASQGLPPNDYGSQPAGTRQPATPGKPEDQDGQGEGGKRDDERTGQGDPVRDRMPKHRLNGQHERNGVAR